MWTWLSPRRTSLSDHQDLSQRVIKPAMVQLGNYVDQSIMALYKQVPSWVGTPGQTINSFADFAVGAQRMDDKSVPTDDRACVLTPADFSGMLGSQTALFIQDAAKGAYREGSLGKISGIDTYMSQNVPSHTVGSDAAAPSMRHGRLPRSTTTASRTLTRRPSRRPAGPPPSVTCSPLACLVPVFTMSTRLRRLAFRS